MNKFDISPKFAERLGAYMEGNLSMEESFQMEQMIGSNTDLCSFVDELKDSDDFLSFENWDTLNYLDMGMDFALPEIPNSTFGLDNGFANSGINMFDDFSTIWRNNDLNISGGGMEMPDESFGISNNDMFN